MKQNLTLLLIEDNPADAELVEHMLSGNRRATFEVAHVERLADARERLTSDHLDVVLVDLGLPDSQGMDTLRSVQQAAPQLPIIVLTGNMDEETAMDAVRHGAQDYLVKGRIDSELLCRSIQYAIERSRAEQSVAAAEARYRRLFESMLTGVIYQSADGRITEANPAAERILGLSLDQMRGRTSMDPRWRAVREDGSPFPGEEHPSMIALRTGKPVTGVVMGVHKPDADEPTWIGVHAIPEFRPGESTPFQVYATFEDVTEQRNAGVQVEAERRRAQQYLDLAHVMFLALDPDGRITMANPTACALLEASEADLLGTNWFARFVPERERDAVKQVFKELTAGQDERSHYENWVRCASGEEKWIGWHNTVLRDDRGAPNGVLCAGLDLTDRLQSERDLRQSEERFRAIFESAPDAYYINDLQGSFVDGNRAAEDLTGYARHEIIGQSFFKLNMLPPEELPRAAQLLEASQCGAATGPDELTLLRKDGKRVQVEILTHPLIVDGRQVVLGVARDITARRRAEQRVRETARFPEENPNPVMRVSRDGRLVYANPASAGLLESWEIQTGDEVPEQITQAAATALAGGAVQELETRFGEKLYAFTFTPVVDAGYVNIYTRDITEQRSLEQQLRESQKMEAIGQLAGGIAHDFNNMLGAIIGYTDMLVLDLEDNEQARGEAEQIKDAANRAAALTRQLLAFSRRQVLEPKTLDLNQVLQDLSGMVQRLIGDDVVLETTFADELGCVKADPSQVEQVMLNLAVNARDAMPGGGRLTIETANVQLDEDFAQDHVGVTPGDYAMIAVTDTGGGMDEEVRQRIFEPFFTTKERGRGTGLGLSTVYGIVKQSGGSIWVYSEVGHGTTFKVYLPRVEGVADASKRNTNALAEAPGGTETVLLVEDDQALRTLIRRILTRGGFTVIEASDGDDAVTECRKNGCRTDLLITDVIMPGMTGPKLAARMHERHPGLPVLYISGYTDGTVLDQGLLPEGRPFIQKPFTAVSLLQKVREVLDEQHAQKH